jgi:hypothetical protein
MLTGPQLNKKFHAFYGMRRLFITAFKAPVTCPYPELTESVQVRGIVKYFVILFSFCGEELLAPRPTLKLEEHLLSTVHDCLFHTFTSTLNLWEPFLHLPPEDMPCCGDRDPLIMAINYATDHKA